MAAVLCTGHVAVVHVSTSGFRPGRPGVLVVASGDAATIPEAMSDVSAAELQTTVLHDWHRDQGATMVGFAGFDMPVQYETGTIAEHLATRRHCGLFDVSHMGRFRFGGPHAEALLSHVLTNDPASLEPGQAHYTFIANEAGGALDDAYLYRLDDTDFLLVVNADNLIKDWDWISSHNDHPDAMANVSEEIAMVALQGPVGPDVIRRAFPGIELPESKRNRLVVADIDSHSVIVARTGYTGEASAFELFPPRGFAVELWERLAKEGAQPVGLGARDSLRLEAGLPLYGHELGEDRNGVDIPIFANSLASFGVRRADGAFIGHSDLTVQRAEYELIKRGELKTPVAERRLTHLVQALAVFDGRKPLRAGYDVLLDGEEVGYVTSGTSVPYSLFDVADLLASPTEDHALRPLGLALIRSDIVFRSDRPVSLEVRDTRGRSSSAELVQKNLWSTAPYGRPYRGFEQMVAGPVLATEGLVERADALAKESEANHRWRRTECVNLIPSEQSTSAYVDELCRSDPAGRYNEHNRVAALGPNAEDVRYYQGTGFIMEKEEKLRAAMRAFFGCSQVEPRVLSGQMANDVVYDALKQFKNRFRSRREPDLLSRVLVHDLNKGGHLSAQVGGALKNYVALDPRTGRAAVEHFPPRADRPYAVDVDATIELIAETNPELIVFGQSVIIQREPVAPIARFVHEHYGEDNPNRPLIMYDGAHVLGLLGPHFQDPLAEGADVVTGSTHKTFFGPQRGVILSNVDPGSVFETFWRRVVNRTFPGHVSNHHLGTLLGLLGATYEMLEFRNEYPAQVIANAKAFAEALRLEGLQVEGDASHGFTETHQVVLRTARAQGGKLAARLEDANIITNSQALWDDLSFTSASGIRLGTSEMTRFGMAEPDFAELAGLFAGVIGAAPNADHDWQATIREFRGRFLEMRYCFDPDAPAR